MSQTLLIGETKNQINSLKSNQITSNVGFWGEGKTGVPKEKPLRAENRTNKLNPPTCMTKGMRIQPGSHWWKRALSPLRHLCFPRDQLKGCGQERPLEFLAIFKVLKSS